MKSNITLAGLIHKTLIAIFVLIVFSPLLVLILDVMNIATQRDDLISLIIPMGRRLILFSKTLSYAAAVGIGAMVVGVMAGSFIWSFHDKSLIKLIKLLFGISLIMVLVPSYVHALAWSSFLYWVTSVLKLAGLPTFQVQGMVISWWVMLMALIPAGLGFSLIGFRCVDSTFVEGGRLLRNDLCVFFKIIMPLALPAVLVGGIFTFLLTVLDYSVPSLFLINIYSLEIFAEFSATNQPARAFLLSLPLIITTTLIVYYVISILPSITGSLSKAQSKEALPLIFPLWFRFLQLLFLGIIFLQITVPLISLLYKVETLDKLLLSISLANQEIFFTVILASITALSAVPLAVGVAIHLNASKRRKIWFAVAALPLAIPAPIVGIGLIALYSKPILEVVYGTLLLPVMAALVRFLPFAVVIIAVQLKRFDKNLLDASKVFQNNSCQGIIKVRLPLMLPGLIAAFLVTFVLTAGELGATLIVVPPGYSTLTMRIYNFMHYGSSDLIAGLCLAMLITSLTFGFLAYKVITSKGNLRRQI